jgi:hypothetical protein
MTDANEADRVAWTADDDHQLAEAVRRMRAGEDVDARQGETTVPGWVMIAIVLGLVALTGSAVAVVMVGATGMVWWLLRTEGGDRAGKRADDPPHGPAPRGPFGGPGIWL